MNEQSNTNLWTAAASREAEPRPRRRFCLAIQSGVALRLPPQSKMVTVCAVAFLVLHTASAQLLVEHFSYPNGNLGNSGVGDSVWTGGDSPNTSITVNSTAALTGSGLVGSAGSGIIFTGGTFKKKAAPFTAQSGNGATVYCSFLMRIQTASGSTKAFLYLQNGNSASSSPPLGVFLDSSSHLGLGKSVSTPAVSTTALSAGTHLVVVCYNFLSGNDRVDLWLDPTSLGTNPVPAATLTTGTSSSSDASALSYVFLNHAVSQTLWLDEVRVGTTWNDVTPSTSSPPTPSTAPYVTQVFVSPNGLVLRGTNGPANGAFDLLATSNAASPIAQWAEVASDTFDANGHFDITNPIPAGAREEFFRIRIGGGTQPPVAPSILSNPTNKTVLANQSASFQVVASGTAPLSYQWYFNTNTPLSGANSATLNLPNAQTNDAGAYSVIVTNVAGSATSQVAFLTVSNITAPPSITTEPQNQTVTVGQTAVFNVVATGTTPLSYQWYFDTNTPLPDATNASLSLGNAQTNDAGAYSVIVTNALGSATSLLATLTVNLPSTIDFSHVGFGNFGYNVTGAGTNAPSVIVSDTSSLEAYADSNTNVIIYISGTIPISGMSTHIRPNKTVIGLGTNATLTGGGLYLYRSTNVIIRNLTIIGSSEDDIGLHYSDHIWIDHCTIVDATDGGIDITQGSDYVTLSWCKFYYTGNNGHNFVNLLGASDGESDSQGKLHVTFHHNWWSLNCVERMPSVRFGRAHVYNNYYHAPGNDYCVRTRIDAQCLVENNYFHNVKNPWEQYLTSGAPGQLYATNNAFQNVTWTTQFPGTNAVFAPPYSYPLDPAPAIPNLVTNNAGAGKGPFAQ